MLIACMVIAFAGTIAAVYFVIQHGATCRKLLKKLESAEQSQHLPLPTDDLTMSHILFSFSGSAALAGAFTTVAFSGPATLLISGVTFPILIAALIYICYWDERWENTKEKAKKCREQMENAERGMGTADNNHIGRLM
jgi:hypothetical protein